MYNNGVFQQHNLVWHNLALSCHPRPWWWKKKLPIRRSVALTKTTQNPPTCYKYSPNAPFGTCIRQARAVLLCLCHFWQWKESELVRHHESGPGWDGEFFVFFSSSITAGQPKIHSWVVHLRVCWHSVLWCSVISTWGSNLFGETEQATQLRLF